MVQISGAVYRHTIVSEGSSMSGTVLVTALIYVYHKISQASELTFSLSVAVALTRYNSV